MPKYDGNSSNTSSITASSATDEEKNMRVGVFLRVHCGPKSGTHFVRFNYITY